MSKIVALAALVCVPVAGALGYVAHQDPAPPPLAAYLFDQQGLKHSAGEDTDDWLAVALTGPNKGGAMDATQALFSAATHKDLETLAGGKVAYYEIRCQNYSSGGKRVSYSTPNVVRSCVSVKKTRKQVEKFVLDQLKPEPKS